MDGKVLYFDICAVPVYIIIIVTTLSRGMTVGRSNRLYLGVSICAFLADFCEIYEKLMLFGNDHSENVLFWVRVSVYIYYITRNAVNVIYLFFVISMTKTWYKISAWQVKGILMLPYFGLLGLLASNESRGAIFNVSFERGYERGSMFIAVYALAACYLVIGTVHLIVNRYTLDRGAWLSLMSMYFINAGSILFQYFFPKYLIESFMTSLTILFVVLYVQRPERQLDVNTGLPGYRAFCDEMSKINVTGHETKIVIVSLLNAAEMSSYLKESYYSYLHVINDQIRGFSRREKVPCEIYFEQPGNFYIILENESYNPVQAIPDIRDLIRKNGSSITESGALPDPRIVTVNFPGEIKSLDELLRFGHTFARFADYSRVFNRAAAITEKRSYQIEAHIDEILNRAVMSGKLKIRYQPIWSVKDSNFTLAEAVIEVNDEVYGSIDPERLLSAAEERGLIVRIGDRIIEDAFCFASSDLFRKLGLSRLYIGISVTQCMRLDLTDTIWNLREKYRTAPSNIAFMIKESSYENISRILNENLKKLSAQGYTIVLDGFGYGYSNARHLLDMPINAVRLDKSIVSSADTKGGRTILGGMIDMVKRIPLTIMAQGAEDKRAADMLDEMGCDMIQGAYLADPVDKEQLPSV